MNKKYLVFSIVLWIGFFTFTYFISPDALWSKIVFFLILLSSLLATTYIFSKDHCLNIFISLYITSLFLLRFLHQLFFMNFIFLTCLFICLFFLCYRKPEQK
ncbi:MAG: hypothetical protein KIH89_000880 [Candidatus Shapirobacteria bacterium]|nr:hypothetical protein [Candidatus Shapirobacteria bacterium]